MDLFVTVDLFDYGFRDCATYNNIRRVRNRADLFDFEKYPVIYVKCKLSNVASKTQKSGWSDREKDILVSILQMKLVQVRCVSVEGSVHAVIMRQIMEGVTKVMSVNDAIVYRDIARFPGYEEERGYALNRFKPPVCS